MVRQRRRTGTARSRDRRATDGRDGRCAPPASRRCGYRSGSDRRRRRDRVDAAQHRELRRRLAVLAVRADGLDDAAAVCDRRDGDGAADARGSCDTRRTERRRIVHRDHPGRDGARASRRRGPGATGADSRTRTGSRRARGGRRRAGSDRPRAARRDRPSRLDDRPPGRSRAARSRRRKRLDPRGARDGRANGP